LTASEKQRTLSSTATVWAESDMNATLRRLAFAVTLSLAFPAAVPTAVYAQVTVNIHVGSHINHGRRITCQEGRRHLERRGFRNVRAHDCRGSVFVYSGRRNGANWWIHVRSRDGRVIRLDRRR
jgi:hypothetical protein